MDQILISETLFRENSPIQDNVDVSKFVPYVNIAQKIHIEPILGGPLTDELKDQVKHDDLTDDNKALIEKIAPSLTLYSVYQGLPYLWSTLQNKGITRLSSENSETLTVDDLATLRRWIKDDAGTLQKDLTDYLCECKDKYPLWRPGKGCGCGDAPVIELDAGIFLPPPNPPTRY